MKGFWSVFGPDDQAKSENQAPFARWSKSEAYRYCNKAKGERVRAAVVIPAEELHALRVDAGLYRETNGTRRRS